MNRAERLLYDHIPSFRREDGGLYSLYSGIYSRIYASRMHYLHRRGRHSANPGRCQWCGEAAG